MFVGQSLDNFTGVAAESRVIQSGIPINPSLAKITTKKPSKTNTILIIGGSLGAQSINEAALSAAKTLSEQTSVHHIVGAEHIESAREQVSKLKNYTVYDFVDGETMHSLYEQADVVVSRAGATSLAEIGAIGKPAIIIPGSQLSDQQKNARALEAEGICIVLQDNELADSLATTITDLIDDKAKQKQLAKQMAGYGKIHASAAKTVAKEILRVMRT